MKRIIFFSIPLYGHVNYGLKIAKRMKEEGYEVIYYSGKSYREFITSRGIMFQEYSEDIEKLFAEENSTYNNRFMSEVKPEDLDHISEWYKFCSHLYTIVDIFMKTDISTMEPPDLIVYDSAALWGKRIADYFNVPSIASCTPYYYPREYAESDYTKFSELIFQKKLSDNKAYRTIYMMNKSLNGSIFEPLSPTADYKLIYSVKSFQSGESYVDKQTFFVGPLFDDSDNSDIDYDIISNEKINVYIAFGSIYNNPTVFRRIYESCKSLNYNFVLNIGSVNDKAEFVDLPPNWHVVQRINQIELLKNVDLFISHGGVNSVRESMYFAVPLIVLPTEGDTLCTAKDIENCNVGKSVNVSDIEKMNEYINSVVNNKNIKYNCARISDEMHKAGGLNQVSKIINQIIKETRLK